jgi:molybdopterin synthase catalytic subunit
MSISVGVRYFALVKERLGIDRETVSMPASARLGDVLELLVARHPQLALLLPHLRVAVNLEFVSKEHVVHAGDEIALIPPVSGGAPRARLVSRSLDVDALAAEVRRDSDGALVTFVGVVRNHSQGKAVAHLEYEAYAEMAEAKLEAICREVDERWPAARVAVEHRVGRLEIGQAAVAIAVASAHRQEAFRACEWMIERIKQDVPIWKREVGPDGAFWVGMGS